MKKSISENHKIYLKRKRLYQAYGFDVEKERRFVLDKVEPLSGNILEVGTGKGHFTLILAKAGYKFTSVDISKEEQDIARLNLKYFRFEKRVGLKIEDARYLSFKDGSFDAIFSINTVHHLEAAFKVMDEFARITASGGRIVLSDFTDTGFDVLDKIHARDGRAHERGGLGLNDMDGYLRGKGFKVKRHESKFQQVLIARREVI